MLEILKVTSFAQAKVSDCKFCAENWASNSIKTWQKNYFVKWCQNLFKKSALSCFVFKRTNFAQILKKILLTWVCTTATFRSSDQKSSILRAYVHSETCKHRKYKFMTIHPVPSSENYCAIIFFLSFLIDAKNIGFIYRFF